jgi:peptidoglycan/xylan/chitin deacetylase (PgdA/CDA1 family)
MRSIAIMTYHSLDESGSVVSVAPQVFEAQMATLAEAGFRALSLRRALDHRDKTGCWPENSAVLTFDDGFANVHEHGLPVLLRHGFSATVFPVANHISGVNNWSPSVKRLGRQTMLSWDQVKDLSKRGVEVGAHTLSHADLSDLDPEALEREIVGSTEKLSAQLGEPVKTFSYPCGRVSDEAVAIVQRTFRAACTTVHGRASDEPLALLPRVEMFYFRHRQDLRPLVTGRCDRQITLRRWARAARRYRLGLGRRAATHSKADADRARTDGVCQQTAEKRRFSHGRER